jgi:hypothetical protein
MVAYISHLLNGATKSCGCLNHENRQKPRRHGLSWKIPEYRSWINMRQRCLNKNNPRYKDYGGRGIKICKRWSSFENFLADMGQMPGPGYSIERINNDGDYEPDNCIWLPRRDQWKNKRHNEWTTESALRGWKTRRQNKKLGRKGRRL